MFTFNFSIEKQEKKQNCRFTDLLLLLLSSSPHSSTPQNTHTHWILANVKFDELNSFEGNQFHNACQEGPFFFTRKRIFWISFWSSPRRDLVRRIFNFFFQPTKIPIFLLPAALIGFHWKIIQKINRIFFWRLSSLVLSEFIFRRNKKFNENSNLFKWDDWNAWFECWK